MIFIHADIYMKSGLNDQAISILSQYRQDPGEYPFYYLYYMLGLAKLNRQDADADRYLILFLKDFRGQNYIKSGYQKLGWFYFLNGNKEKFLEFTGKITTRGHNNVDADRQADKEAASHVVPNVFLLKSRLLFDGGYYERALQNLLGKNVMESLTSIKDLLEYTYRMGRIYQAMGDYTRALSCYEKTIKDGSSLSYYFAANAALQSGLIYEIKHDLVNAEREYRLCLSMNFDEYKTSLSQKARAGLKRIKQ
jgi:tetratricopeptide (TPR) repeat protein